MKFLTLIFTLIFSFFFTLSNAEIFSNISQSDRLILQKEIQTYLLNNPEVILEALKNLEEVQKNAKTQTDSSLVQENYEELYNDGLSWQGGNLHGDITIIEFVDYRCGYCRKAHKDLLKLIDFDQNIKFIIKEYPILGEKSVLIARIAISVLQLYNSTKYKLIHDDFMSKRIDPTEKNIIQLLERNKLDPALILNHINSDQVTNHLREVREQGQKLNVNGTPTFVIEDNIIRGYLRFEQLTKFIAEIR